MQTVVPSSFCVCIHERPFPVIFPHEPLKLQSRYLVGVMSTMGIPTCTTDIATSASKEATGIIIQQKICEYLMPVTFSFCRRKQQKNDPRWKSCTHDCINKNMKTLFCAYFFVPNLKNLLATRRRSRRSHRVSFFGTFVNLFLLIKVTAKLKLRLSRKH